MPDCTERNRETGEPYSCNGINCEDCRRDPAPEPDVSGADLRERGKEALRRFSAAAIREEPQRTTVREPEERLVLVRTNGDADYLAALGTLWNLHEFKSGSYGTAADPFRNFTDLATVVQGQPDEYPLRRIIEKAIRQVNLLDQERWEEAVEDYLDIAGIALICYVLAKRRAAAAE